MTSTPSVTDERSASIAGAGQDVAAAAGRYARPKPAIPATIWLLLCGNFLVRALGFVFPFMSFHVAQRGHGTAAVGAVLAAFGVGWIVGQLICGWLVDRIGARMTIVCTMMLAAVVLALLAGAHSMPALLGGAALAGLLFDAPRPVLSAAIAELVPQPEMRAKLDAWRYGWVQNAGTAITGAVGGLLADRIGIPVLFLINGLACAAFAVMVLCWMPSNGGHTSLFARATSCHPFSDKRLVLLLLSSVATLTAFMGLYAAMPMLMSARGLNAGAYGLALATNAVAVVVLTPLVTPLLSRQVAVRPRLDILAAAAAWTAVCIGAAAFAHTTAGFSVAAAACALGEIAWFVVAVGIVHRIAPHTQRGRYHGIWGSALAIAAVISPILASYSLAQGGARLVAATTLVAGLIGVVLCLPLARALADVTNPPERNCAKSLRS